MKSNFASFETFCNKSRECSMCVLGKLKKTKDDCRRLHSQAVENNGKVTINISKHLGGSADV